MTRFPLRIEKIVAGGLGLGRHRGQVVFVGRAAPEDLLLVEPLEHRRDYIRAKTVSVLQPSPFRREPPCPYFERCGGCSLMHLRPEVQLETKGQVVEEAFRRVGGESLGEAPAVRAGPETHYRTRARFHVRPVAGEVTVGFYARGTRRVVDIDRCLLLSERTNRTLVAVRQWLARRPARARRLEGFELLDPVNAGPSSVREPRSEGGGRVLLHLVVHTDEGLDRAELEALSEKAPGVGIAVSRGTGDGGRRTARFLWRDGPERVTHHVGGLRFDASMGSFFQGNRFLLDGLVDTVVPTSRRFGETVDLYCGVGLFSLSLAQCSQRVIGVERSAAAVQDARSNARRAGLANVTFLSESASAYALRSGFESADLVVADPPRSGLASEVVAALRDRPPRELRYVSCDPASLGRDAGRLLRAGWELVQLHLFDFFPNTHHIESVATFRPRGTR